jgi:Zn-dependent peptidase ImmA (M78 family)
VSTVGRVREPDYAEAKRWARKVLEANLIVKPPVNAAKVARAYELDVVDCAFKPEHSHVAGAIDFDTKTILVNEDDSPHRKNFTIAHELGHFLLGHNEENGYTVFLRNPDAMVKTPVEQEANCFAANLLVPEPFLMEYLDTYSFITDQQLSKIFGVSSEVIRFRRLYLQ